jgi:hypothetical protein
MSTLRINTLGEALALAGALTVLETHGGGKLAHWAAMNLTKVWTIVALAATYLTERTKAPDETRY